MWMFQIENKGNGLRIMGVPEPVFTSLAEPVPKY
jgi:hypothetical protein